jgi:hypothetical protein
MGSCLCSRVVLRGEQQGALLLLLLLLLLVFGRIDVLLVACVSIRASATTAQSST